jgi:putative transcriptional regulator
MQHGTRRQWKNFVLRRTAGNRHHNLRDSGPIPTESRRRIEALLAADAAGTLSEPFAVLVAAHRQMKADNWGHAVPLRNYQQRARRLSELDRLSALMPLALRSYVTRHLGALKWRTILPGIKQCRITRDARGETSLLRCRPGTALPAHTHEGLEATLVLQGAFGDVTGHYGLGDIAVADDTVDHRPVADRSAECVVFIVLEAPVKLTGPLGRLMQRIYTRCSAYVRSLPMLWRESKAVSNQSNAELYRKRSAICAGLADQAVSPEAAETFLYLAQQWLVIADVADLIEKNRAPSARDGEPHHLSPQ